MTIHDFLKKWGIEGASFILRSAANASSQGETLDADVVKEMRSIADDLASALSYMQPQAVPARLDADRSAKGKVEIVGHFRAGDCIGPHSVPSTYTIRHKKEG